MNKAEDLDMAILSVLLKAHAGGDEIQRLTQLKLALTWDRVDIAQEEIFREDVLWRQGNCTGPSFHDFWGRNKASFPSQKSTYFFPIF